VRWRVGFGFAATAFRPDRGPHGNHRVVGLGVFFLLLVNFGLLVSWSYLYEHKFSALALCFSSLQITSSAVTIGHI